MILPDVIADQCFFQALQKAMSSHQEESFEVELGPQMKFEISIYKHPLRLISLPLDRFHDLAREFMQLFFFSPPDAFISWTKTAEEVALYCSRGVGLP